MSVQSDRRLPPIWFLALCSGVAVVGLTILTPALPLITTELGVSTSAVQQLLTIYLVSLAVGQLFFGSISDRFGRRPVLLFGAFMYAAGSIAALLSTDIVVIGALRAVQGLGAAACTAMSRAMVNDMFERDEAARQLSTIAIALALAPALSLAFGGLIAETAGWQGSMALLSTAGLLLCVLALRYAHETHTHRGAALGLASIVRTYRKILSNPIFVCWTLASGMQVGIFFSLNGFLAYQYQRNGYSLAEFGLWFSLTPVSYIFGNSFNKRWFVARGIERAAFIGCILSLIALSILLLTQLAGLTHALSLALPCMLLGFSNGIVVANSMAGAIDASGTHVGTGTGIVGAWQMAAGGIAGAIIIALGGAQQFVIAGVAVIVMAMISVLSMLYVYRKNRLPVAR